MPALSRRRTSVSAGTALPTTEPGDVVWTARAIDRSRFRLRERGRTQPSQDAPAATRAVQIA
jgi:hypothetical protein